MRKRLAILFLLAILPIAQAAVINALNTPSEIVKGSKLEVYVEFKNDSNETVYLTKVRIELLARNGDLVNSSEIEFFTPVEPNATAVAYGYMVVNVDPGDYSYNVIVYYKQGEETKSETVIEGQDILIKSSSNPRLVLGLTILIFGTVLGFLIRLGSRGIVR